MEITEKNSQIFDSFYVSSRIRMKGLRLKFLVLLTVVAIILVFMIPFQYQLIDASMTSITNQSEDSNIFY